MDDSPIHSLVQHCSERLWWDWEGVARYADGRAGRGTAEQVALGGAGAWSQCWILGNLGKGIGEQTEACYWCCCYCWGRGALEQNGRGMGLGWKGREGEGGGARPRQVPGRQAGRARQERYGARERGGKGREGATEKLQETQLNSGLRQEQQTGGASPAWLVLSKSGGRRCNLLHSDTRSFQEACELGKDQGNRLLGVPLSFGCTVR